MSKELGHFIEGLRTGIGMDQVRLAKALRKHQTYVSKLESGKLVPPVDVLGKLAEVLNVPISELAARIPKTARGYRVTPEAFGLKTEYADIGPDEWELIKGWRKLPGEVQQFVLDACREARRKDG